MDSTGILVLGSTGVCGYLQGFSGEDKSKHIKVVKNGDFEHTKR